MIETESSGRCPSGSGAVVWWGDRQVVNQAGSKPGGTRKSGSRKRWILALRSLLLFYSAGLGCAAHVQRSLPSQLSLSGKALRCNERCFSRVILHPGMLTVKIHCHPFILWPQVLGAFVMLPLVLVLFFLVAPVLLNFTSLACFTSLG